jgi:hypothetical protein
MGAAFRTRNMKNWQRWMVNTCEITTGATGRYPRPRAVIEGHFESQHRGRFVTPLLLAAGRLYAHPLACFDDLELRPNLLGLFHEIDAFLSIYPHPCPSSLPFSLNAISQPLRLRQSWAWNHRFRPLKVPASFVCHPLLPRLGIPRSQQRRQL